MEGDSGFSVSEVLFNKVNGFKPAAVQALIDKGADPNFERRGMSVLLRCVSLCNISYVERTLAILKILVDAGADVNGVDEFGASAVYTACYQSNERVLSFLLANGAHAEVDNSEGVNKLTPLAEACDQRNYMMVSTLIDYGAKPRNNAYALELAIRGRDVRIVELLLSNGAPMEKCQQDLLDAGKRFFQEDMKEMCLNWRTYLPAWSTKTHELFPPHVQSVVFSWFLVCLRVPRMIKKKVPRDVRHLVARYIILSWKGQM